MLDEAQETGGRMTIKIPTHATQQGDTANLVRRLREAGYTHTEIGDWLGVHWRTIYRWGREETSPWQPVAINQMLAHMLARGKNP
jgi:hypothetical protein